MFGISMWEIVLILIVALIVLGPRQLTEVAQTLGKLYRDLQRMSFDVRNAIDLDSSLPPPPSTPSKPSKDDVHRPTVLDEDSLPESGERSGPDFYADLLESSKEEETKEDETKKEAAVSEESKDSENVPATGTKRVGAGDPLVHKS